MANLDSSGKLLVATGAAVVLVLAYAYLAIPLDVGLGFVGGYGAIGAIGGGGLLLLPWLVATAFLAYLAARRVDEIRSSARTVWYTILVVSLTLIWSYPMVIATMYGAVDSLDVELFDYSLALGVVYWAAVVISLVAAPVSALNLFLARAQRTRTYKR